MATADQLKTNRTILKGRITRLETHLNNMKIVETKDVTKQIIVGLKSRLETLQTLQSEFNKLQSDIDNLVDQKSLDKEFQAREDVNDNIYKIQSEYICLIEQFGNPETPVVNLQPNHAQIVPDIKLPSIQLPRFDGSYERWLEFNDIYLAIVHNNVNLSEVQKFYYLSNALIGDAKEIIRSVQISAANYATAWDLIKDRFSNTSIIVNSYIKALFELPAIPRESLSSLRTLSDTATKNVRCLESLNQPVKHWDVILIYLIASKLDPVSQREWQSERSKQNNAATFKDLREFIARKCTALENITDIKSKQLMRPNMHLNLNKPQTFLSVSNRCEYCPEYKHPLFLCNGFKQLDVPRRIREVRKNKLCFNCLRNNHFTNQCNSTRCKNCNGPHHTLLHLENHINHNPNHINNHILSQEASGIINNSNGTQNQTLSNEPSNQETYPSDVLNNHSINHNTEILLSTAIILVKSSNEYLPCRVLLDPGSQSNFITLNACKKLNLSKQRVPITINCLNNSSSRSSYLTKIEFKSLYTNYTSTIDCIVLPNITANLPVNQFNINCLNLPENIKLADYNLNISTPIELLIGAELYLSLICVGQIKLSQTLTLQKTLLGWIIGGRLNHVTNTNNTNNQPSTNTNLSTIENLVERFWEVENLPNTTKLLTRAETECETHFQSNTVRDFESGRFIVKIPFSRSILELGNSRNTALNRFKFLEKRLVSNSELKIAYHEFINEYIQMGHMTLCDDEHIHKASYYLPHHPVLKTDSLTTKLRVVFDASCETDKKNSLNSLQLKGAILQDDLFSILLRFRQHRFVIVADVEKMFRQILIHNDHKKYQRILWRENPDMNVKCYELNTVTYGTTSAPFLATRCLHELARIFKPVYPIESEIIEHDFYMDDLVTGAETSHEIHNLRTNISKILDTAKFTLRKWLSNDSTINSELNSSIKFFNLADDSASKTLGIFWDAKQDTLKCTQATINCEPMIITKRTILSQTAQLFDPLGLFSPVVIIAKMVMQKLWQLNLSWDESVPQDVHVSWKTLLCQLSILTTISIPRCALQENYELIELHGFSDASTIAYGACVYIRTFNSLLNQYTVRLLTSKSRVAPIKQITLPRLELCAALLLSKLMHTVKSALRLKLSAEYYWSDSTVTIAWIKSDPNRWKVFVCNRITEIQGHSNPENWHHVSGADNPSDLISRGMLPSELKTSKLWWTGPDWLLKDKLFWSPKIVINNSDIQVDKEMKTITLCNTNPNSYQFLEKYSSFSKLKRIIAYCLRFISNCKSKNNRKTCHLLNEELNNSVNVIIKLTQAQFFQAEIKLLKTNRPSNKVFANLNLFLDNEGLIRVGGRLQNAAINFNKKHPLLLPDKSKLTNLIAQDEHIRMLHCGPQQLLYSLRNRFWPVGGRNLTRKIIKQCVKCVRNRPASYECIMGNLPANRLKPIIPFTVCGVDYAGPISMRDKKGRGCKTIKVYLCIFVCFATKAVHLDLVTSLTTEAFIATFRRFTARRGKPAEIYSDNATNFVGANTELDKLKDFLNKEGHSISREIENQGVKWNFIPPRSPNFGGLWEAAVKSAKYHMKRVLGESNMTYEDLVTVIVQIEAVLNSRPLTPLSTDPNDLQPLTPAHFLVGKELTTVADPNLFHVPSNRLGAYQQQQAILQGFWRRWSQEYLTSLQLRYKWKDNRRLPIIQTEDVVLIHEDNLPPLRWRMGVVQELHAGTDGEVRVATVRLSDGSTLKRTIRKLCPLPKTSAEDIPQQN